MLDSWLYTRLSSAKSSEGRPDSAQSARSNAKYEGVKSLVVCPLKIELRFLREALEQRGFKFTVIETKLGTVFESENFYLAVAGMGSQKFSEKLQRLLSLFDKVTNVISVGTAGALKSDLVVGDLVLPQEVARYERLLNSANFAFKIHRGEIICVDQPILSERAKTELMKSTSAIAVTMEAPPDKSVIGERSFFEVRAVSDLANENVLTEFNAGLVIAMDHAAELIYRVFSQYKV